eukprot:TRINITY_DN6586_c0_g1_i1.p1 TRINITY_DN6586_c0_g1~~TRINITY_DN6586_c0_g1_i1.p1  ORF type:complete len:265 (-),score=57.61 TRINITY_DN6586_c0_g1_i1:65-838(-)
MEAATTTISASDASSSATSTTTHAPVKAVFFDAGGVLCNDMPSTMLRTIAARYPPEEAAKIQHAHKGTDGGSGKCTVLWHKLRADPTYSSNDYWTEFKQLVPEIKESVEELTEALWASTKHYPTTLEVASDLKKAGYTVGILSNHGNEWLGHVITKYEMDKVFTDSELVLISQAMCCAKPEPEIYHKMISATQKFYASHSLGSIEAANILFLDDKKANVEAAHQCGLQSEVYTAKVGDEPKERLLAILNTHGVHLSK